MDFGKGILEKFGWKDGDGLGREKQGIKRAIKANLKFDRTGLGADGAVDFSNNWWERVCNEAAQNMQVTTQENGEVKVNLKDTGNSVEISTKGYSLKKLAEKGKGGLYSGDFLTADVATADVAVTQFKQLTDEELFKACGGRTAHKGARHGLKLTGKLTRLAKQEEELLAKMQVRNNTTVDGVKESKKKKKSTNSTPQADAVTEDEDCNCKVQKKVKKRKAVESLEGPTVLDINEQLEINTDCKETHKVKKKRKAIAETLEQSPIAREATIQTKKSKKKNKTKKQDTDTSQ